jgi:hypothetical protein
MSRLKAENKTKKVYQTTQADLAIMKKGAIDANFVADHYLRTPTGGTYYRPIPADPLDEERVLAYKRLYSLWAKDGRPDKVWIDQQTGTTYQIFSEAGDIVFWHQHGWLLQPWQLKVHHAKQPDITVISGFGVGKTALIAGSLVILSMTIPNFRGFAVAPQMLQANEVFRYIKQNFQDTLWWKRYVWHVVQKPYPVIEVRGSHLGQFSTIEILSVESDPEKVRTLEGDAIYLDQAEKFDDLEALTVDIGSRLRGTVQGRNRMGRLVFFANSGANPALWQRFDMGDAEHGDQENYLSLRLSSRRDNIYLTKRDIANFMRRFGGNEAQAAQYLDGERPEGKGEWFPLDMVEKNTNPELMPWIQNMAIRERENNPGMADDAYQWQFKWAKETHAHHYEMPADHASGRQYMVIGDPGSYNPPNRNSGVVTAWDITDFPKAPARMVAFAWVFGNGYYTPFLKMYTRFVKKYKAQGRNGFDNTGTQKGFDELYFVTHKVHATGMNMAGTGKNFALNAAKFILGAGMLEMPEHLHLQNQLTNYTLPDTKIRQDIAMTIAMACQYLKQYFYIDIPDDEDQENRRLAADIPYERNPRPARSRNNRRARR